MLCMAPLKLASFIVALFPHFEKKGSAIMVVLRLCKKMHKQREIPFQVT